MVSAPFVRRFDMRWIDRKEFSRKLDAAEKEAVTHFGSPVEKLIASEGKTMVVTFAPAAETIRMAELEGKLTVEVDSINKGNRMSNVTSAKEVGDQFRTALARIKAKLSKTAENATRSFAELEDTANLADETVKAVDREAADLKAALGLSTNNPPAGA